MKASTLILLLLGFLLPAAFQPVAANPIHHKHSACRSPFSVSPIQKYASLQTGIDSESDEDFIGIEDDDEDDLTVRKALLIERLLYISEALSRQADFAPAIRRLSPVCLGAMASSKYIVQRVLRI